MVVLGVCYAGIDDIEAEYVDTDVRRCKDAYPLEGGCVTTPAWRPLNYTALRSDRRECR
jgi:hypothetical protein